MSDAVKKKYRPYGTAGDLKYIGARVSFEAFMVIESYAYNHRGEQISYGEAIERMVDDLKQKCSTRNTSETHSPE